MINYSLEELQEMMDAGGSLDLRGADISELPENLIVSGCLLLSGSSITELPCDLIVGGNLELCGSKISKLPNGFIVGGWLDLGETPIKELPEGLTVGDSLYLSANYKSDFPKDLAIGYLLCCGNKPIREEVAGYHRLKDGEYVDEKYLYSDYLLTHIKRKIQIEKYTYYEGKIANRNVMFDGEHYVYCKDAESGIAAMKFHFK